MTNDATTSNKPGSLSLGRTGPAVFPLGLGCMGMGQGSMYGNADDAEGIATIQAMLERGPALIDTGDFYSMGKNELLIGKALAGRRRDQAVVSVKFGGLRGPDGAFLGFDARPVATKNFLAHSLSRLGLDHIDIYRPGRLDPAVPIEDTIGAIADMVKAGYVRHIGLSEVGVETIRRAAKVHPISDLQIEYSLLSRGPEATIFPALRALGIGVTAYGVLSRGLLTGSQPTGPRDYRAYLPRFTGDAGQKNGALAQRLRALAEKKGAQPAQLAIAWVRARAAAQDIAILPTLGSRKRAQLSEALGALEVSLDAAEVAALEAAVPAAEVAGSRYAAEQMTMLDSER